jgi:regulator of sigma E protease
MLTFLSFIVVLGILIFVHEAGHFAVAKSLGIGVETFSFGFGPRLFGFRAGQTDYRISALPLGGFVKLRGENPGEGSHSADKSEDLSAVAPSSDGAEADPRSFALRPAWQRGLVIMAGPVMNLILALAVLPAVFVLGIRVPAYLSQPVRVGFIVPASPAEMAGLGRGDLVTAAGGRTIDHWERLYAVLSDSPAGTVHLTAVRAGQETAILFPWKGRDAGEDIGLYPPAEPVIGGLSPGYPAEQAGLRKGDLVMSVGGVTVTDFNEMAQIIRASPGKPLTLKVRRGEEVLRIEVTPRPDEKSGRGLLGVLNDPPTELRRVGALAALAEGTKLNLARVGLTFRTLGDLLTLRGSIKEVGGPIMIYQATGTVARAGLPELLGFIAFLSLQLAVFNLLPVPILDGGHILFLGVEMVIRRPVKMKHREVAQQVGLALLLLLILVVSYNDIVRLVTTK